MTSKIASQERQHFSDRLQDRLRKAGIKVKASVVAHEFNLRADGAAITTHAARKWLLGEAMPTHERMRILAGWLGVHASWLQYGDAENGDYASGSPVPDIHSSELMLIQDYRRLPEHGQKILRQMMSSLLALLPREPAKPDQAFTEHQQKG